MSDGLIVALGPVPASAAAALAPFGEVVVAEDATSLQPLLAGAVGLIARGASRVDAGLLAAAPALRVIGRSGTGTDLVDLDAATARGIPVVVTPDAGTNAVAEGAIAMLLALTKRLGELDALVRDGRWAERDRVAVGDLEGATLGIVGYGRIGRRLAELAAPFGMTVLAADPALDAAAAPPGVEVVDLPELFDRARAVSLHAPLTARTRSLVGRSLLSRLQPGAVLVNLARGGLLDLDAVAAALADGTLAGVGLDVFEPEPPDLDHPVLSHPRVLLSPHALGLSEGATRRIFAAMTAGMAAVLRGERPEAVANPGVYEVVPG